MSEPDPSADISLQEPILNSKRIEVAAVVKAVLVARVAHGEDLPAAVLVGYHILGIALSNFM